jgi:hypothetical protein
MKTRSSLALEIAFSLVVLLVTPLRARFAYVTNGGGNNISAYSIGSNGALTPVPGSPFAVGSGANSVAMDPTGKFAYHQTNWSHNASSPRKPLVKGYSLSPATWMLLAIVTLPTFAVF